MTTHVCKLIALHTANAYSAECKMLVSACTCSMPGCVYLHFSGRVVHVRSTYSTLLRWTPRQTAWQPLSGPPLRQLARLHLATKSSE